MQSLGTYITPKNEMFRKLKPYRMHEKTPKRLEAQIERRKEFQQLGTNFFAKVLEEKNSIAINVSLQDNNLLM